MTLWDFCDKHPFTALFLALVVLGSAFSCITDVFRSIFVGSARAKELEQEKKQESDSL